MDLRTTYLGLDLPHPLICGASPLVDDLDAVRRVEAAGAAAIVMHSLFEEQIEQELDATAMQADLHHDSYAEALSFFPDPSEVFLGPRAYLRQIEKIKAAVRMPVIASLNGTTAAGWTRYARFIEEAGADALELNVYLLASHAETNGAAVEARVLDLVAQVRHAVKLKLAVKLSPFFSSLPNLARRLHEAGADALVLFNRFYQPDIDIENLEVTPKLALSDSSELLLRLRWLAILRGRVDMQLAATGGVHTPQDVIKALMVGADVVQVVSALLRHGPEHLTMLRAGVEGWMRDHGYSGVAELRGSMCLDTCPDPEAFERANYARVLQTWRVR